MTREIEFTDRYQAAGIPYPETETVCLGPCEGMGCYPQFCFNGVNPGGRTAPVDMPTEYELHAWREEHEKAHRFWFRLAMAWRFKRLSLLWEPCDGWHFIKCPDCGGTGKRGTP